MVSGSLWVVSNDVLASSKHLEKVSGGLKTFLGHVYEAPWGAHLVGRGGQAGCRWVGGGQAGEDGQLARLPLSACPPPACPPPARALLAVCMGRGRVGRGWTDRGQTGSGWMGRGWTGSLTVCPSHLLIGRLPIPPAHLPSAHLALTVWIGRGEMGRGRTKIE